MFTVKEYFEQTPYAPLSKSLLEVVRELQQTQGEYVSELNVVIRKLFFLESLSGEAKTGQAKQLELEIYQFIANIQFDQLLSAGDVNREAHLDLLNGVISQLLADVLLPLTAPAPNVPGQPVAENRLERLEKIPLAGRIAVLFLEGEFVKGLPPEWRNGEWRNEHPSKLVDVLYRYMNEVILQGDARAQDRYFSPTVTGHSVSMPDHSPTFMDVMKSFVGLSNIFAGEAPVQPNLGYADKSEQLSAKVLKFIETATQIQRSFGRGHHVWEHAEQPEHLITFYQGKENKLSSVDLERLAAMGGEWQKELGEILLGERLLWSQQAYYAMNDPENVEWAIFPAKTGDAIVRNAKIKNPLSLYPELAATDADSLVKRFLLQEIAGSNTPPLWVTNPVTRGAGESLHLFAERKRAYMQKCLAWRLYGTGGSKEDPKPGSLWNKFLSAGHGHAAKKTYLSAQERSATGVGWLPEMIGANEYQFRLNGAVAEGQSLTKTDKTITHRGRIKILRVVDSNSGPASKFWLTRLRFAGTYRSKLGGDGRSESSPGPLPSMPDFHTLMQSADERYNYIPKEEWEGITLREAIILCNNGDEFAKLPYSQIIDSVEGQEPWSDQIKWAETLYKRLTNPNGLGIDWSAVASFEPGSNGTILSLNLRPVIGALGGISRDAYYLLTRDFGKILKTWETAADYQRFRSVEAALNTARAQLSATLGRQAKPAEVLAAKPAQIGGVQVTDGEWREVIRLTKIPTSTHVTFDVPKYDEDDKVNTQKVMRWSTNAFEALAVETDPARMDKFEQLVIGNPDNPNNDWYMIFKKLIVGKQIIGDLFAASLKSFQYEDLQAIRFVLSQQAWEDYNKNPLITATRKLLKFREKEYQGIGYFSAAEVDAMLEVAGIDVGFAPIIQSVMSNLGKVPH